MIVIERIDKHTYSFQKSDRLGLGEVAKALTFPNPNPISKNRTIKFFSESKLTFPLGMITTVKEYLDKGITLYQA